MSKYTMGLACVFRERECGTDCTSGKAQVREGLHLRDRVLPEEESSRPGNTALATCRSENTTLPTCSLLCACGYVSDRRMQGCRGLQGLQHLWPPRDPDRRKPLPAPLRPIAGPPSLHSSAAGARRWASRLARARGAHRVLLAQRRRVRHLLLRHLRNGLGVGRALTHPADVLVTMWC
jgi:hypothetical protein